MNQPTAHPLCWPVGWPRTQIRQSGAFKTDTARALYNLKRELELMRAKGILLSSNYTLGVENPSDPGVCAYFEWDGLRLAIPCDRWDRISHNIQAIALTVEAMRGMERWGAKHMIRAMFTGFKQLANKGHDPQWWITLGVGPNSGAAEVKEAYRRLAQEHHPDKNGDPDVFRRIQVAYETWQDWLDRPER